MAIVLRFSTILSFTERILRAEIPVFGVALLVIEWIFHLCKAFHNHKQWHTIFLLHP
ncbi:MAG: hypothetical protein GXY83_02140 [Rhodopirellula sp.]|nr:hypothetical protein [Rhodopirellula sp.]